MVLNKHAHTKNLKNVTKMMELLPARGIVTNFLILKPDFSQE